MPKREPTAEQVRALADYAALSGRYWKRELNHDWMTGKATGILQQIRNEFGPSWLVRFRLPKKYPVHCDQCQMLSINGVACHEIGCQNMGARWDRESGVWIKQRECFDCGCTVDADDPCCSAPMED